MKKHLLVLLFLCVIKPAYSQEYDTVAALNCCKSRWVKVGADSVFVPQNMQYHQGILTRLVPYGWGYVQMQEKDSIINYWPDNPICLKTTFLGFEAIAFSSVDSSLFGKKLHYITYTSWASDTFVYPMDGVGQGNFMAVYALSAEKLWDSFYIPKKNLQCSCDTFCDEKFWGFFIDEISGEELYISKDKQRIDYRSNKNKKWITLYVFGESWGVVNFGFTSNPKDSKNSFSMLYKDGNWILQGHKAAFSGFNRNPQFFKKL